MFPFILFVPFHGLVCVKTVSLHSIAKVFIPFVLSGWRTSRCPDIDDTRFLERQLGLLTQLVKHSVKGRVLEAGLLIYLTVRVGNYGGMCESA